MTWREYEDQRFERSRLEALQAMTFDRERWELDHPPQTSRERYGWRGLTGTSYLGKPPQQGKLGGDH